MKRIIPFMFLGVFGIYSGAFAQASSSKWQGQPIVIDGDGSDWGTLPRFFNADSNIKYEFRNDAQNLYLILKPADRNTQMQLISAGFSVKLKVKTSPPIKVGLNFPASKMGMSHVLLNTDKLADKTETDPEFMPKDTAILEGFQFAKGKCISDNKDEKEICFARSKSIRTLATYEIRIPLKEIFGNEFSLETVSSTPIQLQIIINDLSQNEMKKMKGRMGGGMHGGGRGMGGSRGGMGGEMNGSGIGGSEIGEAPGGDQSEMQSNMEGRGIISMERKSFSIDFKLSTGK